MSNKKLQKICYYAYSLYLVQFGRRIAPAHFEAWVHGPVSREIYNNYKSYGWKDIPQNKEFLIVDNTIYKFAENIWEQYGSFSAEELERMTHKELPWLNARKGLKDYESSDIEIDDNDIIAHFSKEKTYS